MLPIDGFDQMMTITGDPSRVSGVERQISPQKGRHADRVALFDRISALYDADLTIRDIAQELDLGLRRVQRCAETLYAGLSWRVSRAALGRGRYRGEGSVG